MKNQTHSQKHDAKFVTAAITGILIGVLLLSVGGCKPSQETGRAASRARVDRRADVDKQHQEFVQRRQQERLDELESEIEALKLQEAYERLNRKN